MNITRIKMDDLSRFFFSACLFGLLWFDNGLYLFLPSISLLFICFYIFQPYKSPIFPFIAFQHYIQIVTGAILCNYLGKEIDYDTPYRSVAIVLSSVGIIVLFAPIAYVQNKQPAQTKESLLKFTQEFSVQKVIQAYLISFFVASVLGSVAFLFGGLTQIIFWLVNIKWILFLLFGYIAILRNERRRLFYLFILLEFISGFYSFFSDFKTVIYYLLVLLLTFLDQIDFKKVLTGLVAGIFLLFIGVIWTNIKGEYRKFLNSGEETQRVNVNSSDALDKLYNLSSGVDRDKFNSSIYDFLERVQYTFHFAKTIQRVPEIIPFQNGKNWLTNLEFTTTPRFLNPDKPVLDQTEKTKFYTGIKYSGKDKGVSFSLGYFAECYIDFGKYGMMFILFLIGVLYAFFYNYLLRKSSTNIVFNYCVVAAFFMDFNPYAMDATFLIGRMFSGMLTFFVLVKFFFPVLMDDLTNIKREGEDY